MIRNETPAVRLNSMREQSRRAHSYRPSFLGLDTGIDCSSKSLDRLSATARGIVRYSLRPYQVANFVSVMWLPYSVMSDLLDTSSEKGLHGSPKVKCNYL